RDGEVLTRVLYLSLDPAMRGWMKAAPAAELKFTEGTEEMALEPTKHVNGRMWQPGQSRNPNGRPVGSRTAFSAGFLKDLAEVWSDEGREAMVKTAKTNPTVFFATCARLIGPEVKLTIEQQLPGNLSPADWNLMMQILDAVKSAIPDALAGPQVRCLSLCLAH